mmetsp:Transcript_49407/g.154930  ORF Transcript_49407/g.154930 Transcript_49407/m.154930 type:complete len:498 (+) Transcript_49407:84-1577(+)
MNLEGGSSDQRAIFEFIQACATLNLLPLQDRKGFKVEKNTLATSLRLLSYSLAQRPFSGITFRTIHLFQAINNFLSNEENKILLFRMGLVENLVEYTRAWSEDPSQSLNDQLEVLELAFQMILTMSSLHACKLLLRRQNFGTQIVRFLTSKPSDIVLQYCKGLIEELKYMENVQDFLVRPKTSMSSHSTMGASRTIPRNTSGQRLRTVPIVSTSLRREASLSPSVRRKGQFSPLKVEPFKRALRISLVEQAVRRWKAILAGLQEECFKNKREVPSDAVYQLFTSNDVLPNDHDWELFLEGVGADPVRGCSPAALLRAFCTALGQPQTGQGSDMLVDQEEEVLQVILLKDLSRFEKKIQEGCHWVEEEDVTVSALADRLRELGWELNEVGRESVRMACSSAHSNLVDVRMFRETLHEIAAGLRSMPAYEAMEEIGYETSLHKWMKQNLPPPRKKSLALQTRRAQSDGGSRLLASFSASLVNSTGNFTNLPSTTSDVSF